MAGMTDHIKKIKKDQEDYKSKNSNFGPQRNIWHNWEMNDQVVRFVGDFITTRNHWMPPSQFNALKLFVDDAFTGENSLPKLMNCANWDIKNEKHEDCGCVLCTLNKISREVLRSSGLDEDTKKEFTQLKSRTDFRSNYRWNLLDRDNPIDEDGNLIGYKIATIGYELFESLTSIHEEYSPSEFSSVDEGLDIKVTKSEQNKRTQYRAQAVFKGPSLKVTPLNEEEKELEPFNLVDLCGRQIDTDLVMSKLLPKWRTLIENYMNGDSEGGSEKKKEDAAF